MVIHFAPVADTK